MLQGVRYVFLLFLVSQILSVSITAQQVPERVVILFDRSSSMNAMLEGVPKIEMGRQLFKQLATDGATNEHVLVRFFAGGLADDDASNCKASVVALPFGARAAGVFESLYADLTAKGKKTPLAYATELAKTDLDGWRGERRIIIISDGMDTCGEDPLSLADELGAADIELDVIGLGEAGDLGQLAEMGLAGGAEFQLAGNYGAFAGAVGEMLPGMPPMPASMPMGAGTGAGGAGPAGSGGMGGPMGAGAGSSAGGAGAGKQGGSGAGMPVVPLPPDQPIVVELRMKPDTDEPEDIAVEVILDASGSMAGRIDGKTKMSLAMAALEKSLGSLDSENVHLGLRAYGFDTTLEKTPEASCPNTELLTDFQPNNASTVLEAAKTLPPYGYTPIAASISAAAEDLKAFEKMKRQIVLITDGEETCDGDPIAALKAMAGMCVDVNAHIIGFDLAPKARAEMQAIAAAGCGLYLDAPTGPELEKALLDITEVVEAKTRIDWTRFANPVTGGATFEEAVSLAAGAYTFENHMQKGEKQYFHIPLTSAQRLRLVVTAQGRLVRFNAAGELVEQPGYDFTSFWADFLKADGSKIRGPGGRLTFRSVDPGYQEEIQLLNLDEAGIIMLVHANSMLINKDTRIDLVIDEAGDVTAGNDAPDKPDAGPIQIVRGQSVVGHIGLQDRTDIYRVEALGGETLKLNFNPTHAAFKYRIIARQGDNGRAIKRYNGLSGRQEIEITMPEDATGLLIEVVSQVPGNKIFSSYVFVVGDAQ